MRCWCSLIFLGRVDDFCHVPGIEPALYGHQMKPGKKLGAPHVGKIRVPSWCIAGSWNIDYWPHLGWSPQKTSWGNIKQIKNQCRRKVFPHLSLDVPSLGNRLLPSFRIIPRQIFHHHGTTFWDPLKMIDGWCLGPPLCFFWLEYELNIPRWFFSTVIFLLVVKFVKGFDQSFFRR